MNEDFLHRKLKERLQQNSLRQLRQIQPGSTDFSSNDYLGIAKNKLLLHPNLHNSSTSPNKPNPNDLSDHYDSYDQYDPFDQPFSHGSTGSRLLTGNYPLIEETEKFIAAFHQADSALIFNSGYDANTGLLSSIPQRGDTILYDYLSHASIRDGIRLSFADSFSFQHNDLADLEQRLKKAKGNCFVVTESVFSMDGDTCPLDEMVTLCEKYNAHLIIDEAHATGVIGEKGEGLVQKLHLQSRVFARVHTFGKACAVHGAAVLGSTLLRDYLINFARSFVYSTALPEQAVAHIRNSYERFPRMTKERERLQTLIEHLQASAAALEMTEVQFLKSNTPIQGVIIPGNGNVKKAGEHLIARGFDIRPILYPTVPKGLERLRIVLHAFNTTNELDLMLNCLKNSL